MRFMQQEGDDVDSADTVVKLARDRPTGRGEAEYSGRR